jgi:hypothetical protein
MGHTVGSEPREEGEGEKGEERFLGREGSLEMTEGECRRIAMILAGKVKGTQRNGAPFA